MEALIFYIVVWSSHIVQVQSFTIETNIFKAHGHNGRPSRSWGQILVNLGPTWHNALFAENEITNLHCCFFGGMVGATLGERTLLLSLKNFNGLFFFSKKYPFISYEQYYNKMGYLARLLRCYYGKIFRGEDYDMHALQTS